MRLLSLFLALFFTVFICKAQSILDSLLYSYEDQIGSEKIETGIKISRYHDNDDLLKSLEYGNEVMAFAEEFGTSSDLLAAHNRMGIIFNKLGDLSQSNDHFLEALALVTRLDSDNLSNESRLMNNIANNYDELKQPRLAIVYYKRSLALKKRMLDSARYSITLNNLALTYSSLTYYDSAYSVLKEALIIDKLLKDDVSVAYSNGSLGEIFLEEGNADSAIFYLTKSLSFFNEKGNADYVLAYYNQKLGEASLLDQQPDIAYSYFKEGLKYAQKVGAKPIQKDCYRGLEILSNQLGEYKDAYEYSRLYTALQDTLYKSESAQKLSAIETSYQIKNKEQEISILNANAQVDKFKFYSAIGFVFVVIILLGFMYYRYLFKTKANYLLQQKNNTIQKQNKEIMDSVEYAKGIQEAILPNFTAISGLFSNAYLYYKPSQVVSGDFYWIAKINGNIVWVLADGTGHGVPGAFLSVMGASLLKQIISENRTCKPNEILAELNRQVIESLGQSELNNTLKDGMDVAICTYNVDKKRLAFSGAKRPMLIKTSNKVKLIKGNRSSIGGDKNANHKFDVHYFDLDKGDSVILYTDGIIDQFGGERDKKFLTKRLVELLEESDGIEGVKSNFDVQMKKWKNGGEQTDDMLLLAVEI